jgi:type IV pilus assembly protein PilW
MTSQRTSAKRFTPGSRRNTGFSLVELMVAMTLSLILMAGVVSVVVNTSRSHGELSKTSRQLENGRYALQVLREDIRHAGFYGEFHELTAPTVAPAPCDVGLADLEDGMSLPVQGFLGGAGAPLTCLPGYVAGTDVLVIRRASTSVTALAALSPNDVYLQSRSDMYVLNTGANAGLFALTQRDGTPAEIRRYVVHIYYVRGCSDCAGGGDGIPTLSRVELSNGNLNTVVPLAEGIENLQLRYGVDVPGGNGAPSTDPVRANAVGSWFDAVTVEINLLARSVEPSAGYTDTKTYDLSGGDGVVTVTPGGNFKRHAFNAVVRVVNPSSRRES